MALALADDQRYQGRIRTLADWLVKAQHGPGDGAPGAWGYTRDDKSWWDNSNSQFALLGLREAARSGVEIPLEVWLRAQNHWMNHTQGSVAAADGVQFYYGTSDLAPRGSMQVAGISSLMITSDFLRDDENVGPNGEINCCGALPDDDVHAVIEAAFRWLGRPGNFAVSANPGRGQTWHLYYLYGLERAGRFTGRRFIGDFDWYRLGVSHLVTTQNPRDSSWFDQSTGGHHVIGTALALLFLSKGNSPILINKLKYGDPDSAHYGRGWNRHPRDVANLTDYISTRPRWPKLLSWQVADLSVAAEERDNAALLQAKVQYLSGDGPLDTITDEQVELLREYINQGGFLFAVNTCGGAEFDRGLRELIRRMYPAGDFKLEKLPTTHDVYRSEHVLLDAPGFALPELWGVDIGCRTAIMYAPYDHACRWNKWMRFDPPRRALNVKAQIKRSMELATNVIAYATGRELMDALTPPELLGKIDPDATSRGHLEIARLRHTGGWDMAPNALRHLQLALESVGVAAAPQSPNLPATDPELFDYPLLYMHGRKNFRMTEAERTQLRTYLDNGGFLFADAGCGSPQFDESFRSLVRQLFDRELEPIPLDHELFNSELGHDIREVRRRLPLEGRPGAPIQSDFTMGPPVLEGITDESGRYILIYSKYDLSCALERQATVNCAGYASEDAARIATNIVIYALAQ
jgi:hypothetical protein